MQRSCGISKLIVLVVLLVVGGCRDEEERPGADVKEYGVVVLASEEDRWNLQETAEWCIQNIKRAQAGLDRQISLRVTFKNQADEDLTDYVNEIGKDDSVVAIIGPMKSIYAEEVAKALEESEKLMISPSATNFEYQRRFGGLDYVWNMAESDIAQIEMLLQKAQRYKYEEVVLLMKENGATTSDDSFADWLAYVAEEMDVQIGGVLKYMTEEELRGTLQG